MQRKQLLKPGEKLLFTVFGAFLVLALVGYVMLEMMRSQMTEPMFASRTSFNFSAEGRNGSKLFREAGCTACHRAMRNGTNHGVILDGIGSRRSAEWLESFLARPEATYATRVIDHGPGKEAGYVSTLPPEDRHDIAVFLSQLKAEQGSAMARLPPEQTSSFVQRMARFWAPEEWKSGSAERRNILEDADAKLRQGERSE